MDDTFEKAILLYKNKKYEKALKEFLKCDYNLEEHADLSYYLALCHTQLKQYDEAILFLEQVINTHSGILYIYQCRMILCYIYSVTEQYRLADFELKRLIDDGYESVQVYCFRGYVYYHQGQTEEAIEYFKKALSVDPEHAATLNSIGYIFADENLNPSIAVAYCRKAVEKVPDHYPFMDSLGWALFKFGKADEALGYLKSAFEKSKGNKIISKHLKQVIDSRK